MAFAFLCFAGIVLENSLLRTYKEGQDNLWFLINNHLVSNLSVLFVEEQAKTIAAPAVIAKETVLMQVNGFANVNVHQF